MADTRPLRKYLCMLPDNNDPNSGTGEAVPMESPSPELARKTAAVILECEPKLLHIIDVTDNPQLLAVVDAMLNELGQKH